MLAPISQFGYTKITDLEIEFTSLSLNVTTGTTYLWDFGDGSGTSSQENESHTFSTPGFYQVSLKVTNPDNQESIEIITLNLSGTPAPTLFTNIPNLVDLYSPTSIIGTIRNHNQKDFLIAKWQQYLQPLVINPEVAIVNTHLSQNWPPLVNSLIAKLVVIDIVEMESTAFLLNVEQAGANQTIPNTSNTSTTSSSNGGIKSIETGPTKVERFEDKDSSSVSEKTWNLAKTFKDLIVKDGVLDMLKKSACQDSKRLSIYLPMCGPLPNKVFSPSVVKPCKGNGVQIKDIYN